MIQGVCPICLKEINERNGESLILHFSTEHNSWTLIHLRNREPMEPSMDAFPGKVMKCGIGKRYFPCFAVEGGHIAKL